MLLVIVIVVAVLWLPTEWGLALITVAAVIEIAEVGVWLWYSRRRKVVTGAEALPGMAGVVVAECRPLGQVRVAGERWRARCDEGAAVGDAVVVERLEPGLTLAVRKQSPN